MFIDQLCRGHLGAGAWGGAVYASGGSLSGVELRVGHRASDDAGILPGRRQILAGSCSADLRNCIFLNNRSPEIAPQSCYHGLAAHVCRREASTTVRVETAPSRDGNSCMRHMRDSNSGAAGAISAKEILTTNRRRGRRLVHRT